MLSSDIGSMPARADMNVIRAGAKKTNSLLPFLGVSNQDYNVFEKEVTDAFIDKLKAGVDVPTYPQFRDMNEMYFELMTGIEKLGDGLVAVKPIKAKQGSAIPESMVLKRQARFIKEESGVDQVRIKLCVTGPYTLASFFQVKTPGLYRELGHAVSQILKNSLFRNRSAEVAHVSVDEPVLGFMNDPLLDYGSDGREALRSAWEEICSTATSFGIDASMHLHNTSENLFWDVENLGTIASHVGDPLYSQEATRQQLEEKDKHLWVAIGVTQFDSLIKARYEAEGFAGNIPEKIGEVWSGIRKDEIDPYSFLEEPALLRKRLEDVADYFGADRISYASPECGLNSFPEYGVALECLSRASRVVSEFSAGLDE